MGTSSQSFGGRTGRVFATSEPWWPPRPEAPRGAPNVVIIVVDDLGYADLGCYGSEIATPHIDALAARGLQYTNFHSTPMCSPTRAALLSGMNPHAAGVGTVAHSDPGFPGYAMELAPDVVTLPETLRAHGYATYMVGKWHLTKDSDQSDAGPFHSWPLQRGFDRYYGFLDAFTNFHQPHRLIRDNSPVDIDEYPEGYYLTDDLTDEAIAMVRAGLSSSPGKPFFLYLAHGAVHAPLQAPQADIEAQRGRYDLGWDALREQRFARQQELGVIEPHTRLAPRNTEKNHEVQPWDDLSADDRRLFARYMEVFAAMVETVDRSTGRLLDALHQFGVLDNTIVLLMSDNGASREGEMVGTTAYMVHHVLGHDVDADRPRIELVGGPQSASHYPRGWGMAGNTPFRLYKINTHAGGHTVPLVCSWPAGGLNSGEKRRQYAHVSDVMPTLLDLLGIDPLRERQGIDAKPMTGVSMVPTMRAADAPAQRTEQIYEQIGHRGFYRNGWEAVTIHHAWTSFASDTWELFDVRNDPSPTVDLSTQHPERLRELVEAWEQGANEGQIFPLDEGTGLKYLLRPPRIAALREPVVIHPGTPTLERWRSLQLVFLRSFSFRAPFSMVGGAAGALVAHGDQSGGYALYVVEGGVPVLVFNTGRGQLVEVRGPALSMGEHEIECTFEAIGKSRWRLSMTINGVLVDSTVAVPMLFGISPFQGISIGRDPRSPVWWERHVRHGASRWPAPQGPVTYLPGGPPPDMGEGVVDMLRQLGATYE